MNKPHCWICRSDDMMFARASSVAGALDSEAFAITDSHYGMTGELYLCRSCGFLQCTDLPDVTPFYEALEDGPYESGRARRALQAKKLLDLITPFRREGRLLDIGAGSGILVEQAVKAGFDAQGIEPSVWLRKKAAERGLTVHAGVFPHPGAPGDFDVMTLVDVIEHVGDPAGMLAHIAAQLAPCGFGLVVTPDRGALIPRLMGWKWWHYRIAHIGYFNRANLLLALDRAGLRPVAIGRPGWFFGLGYLLRRVFQYLPPFLRFPVPEALDRITVPLNLRDSLYVVFRKK